MNQIVGPLRQAIPLLLAVASFALCTPVQAQTSRSSKYVSTARHASEPSRKSIRQISDKIDSLVMQKLSDEGLKRNKRSNDSVFVRRVYVDIIGRIPSLEETRAFLTSRSKSKREDLIDALLNSYGRTSQQFNFWADLLRITSQMGNGLSGQPYIDFVKDSLEHNKPYDEFVQELLTASGANLAAGNGAVGYYLRDRNMPVKWWRSPAELTIAPKKTKQKTIRNSFAMQKFQKRCTSKSSSTSGLLTWESAAMALD